MCHKTKLMLWMLFALVISIMAMMLFTSPVRSERSPTYRCIDNLRILQIAKDAWANDHGKTLKDTPMRQDLKVYLGANGMPKCPSAGTYVLGSVGESPSCSLPGHRLSSHVGL